MDFIGFLIEFAPRYLNGFQRYVSLALFSFVIAFVIGVIIASFRVSPIPPLQRFGTAYVSVFRNTPLLVLLFLFFFGGPKLGLTFSPYATTVLVLGLYTGAYLGETIRSGINAVSKGQAEAARAIGLGFTQVLGFIVVPQALRTVVGPIGNLFIANAKNTALGLTIGYAELTSVAQTLANREARTVEAYLSAAFIYATSLLIVGGLFGLIEKQVAIKR